MLETLLRDLRYGARALARAPAFTLAAVLTLAIGIGATTAVYSVLRGVLLAPLPYDHPERRVMIWSRWTAFDKTWISDAELFDYRTRCRTLSQVAAWSPGQGNLTGDGEPIRVGVGQVTANTFSVLGAAPILGRTFLPEEDRPGGSTAVVVMGHGLWRHRYGGDPDLVGRTLQLDGVAHTVVGVMPPGFRLPTDYNVSATEPTQLWRPLALDPDQLARGSHGYYAAAELAPGATAEQASAELRTVTSNLTSEGHYHAAMEFSAFAVPIEEEILGTVRPAMVLLAGAVAFLLLIACANVAHLLLARSESRQREVAVRAALGASRGRLLRQFASESLLLASLAGALGVALAFLGLRALAIADPSTVPHVADVRIDAPVLLFTALVTLATTFVFSLAPALRTLLPGLVESLKAGSQRSTAGRRGRLVRSGLVIAEMALAVVLVIGAGLLLQSLRALQRIDLGFDPQGVLTLKVSLPPASYDTSEKRIEFYDRLARRVRALPEVRHAGVLRSLPLANPIGDWGLDVEGFVETPGNHAKGDWQVASDDAFEALGQRLLEGRTFSATDTVDSALVAIVNETLARRYFGHTDVIGKRLRMGGGDGRPWLTVVGVVGDLRHGGVTEPIKEKFYVPYSQFHHSSGFTPATMTVVVKTASDPLALAGRVKTEVAALDPQLPVSAVQSMEKVVSVLLLLVALAASLLPARRASAVDPVVALRME